MTPERTPQSPTPPSPREEGDRRVRRVTRGVAAAAILGTAVFGGLAYAHNGDSATSSSSGTAASSSSSSSSSDGWFTRDDDGDRGGIVPGTQAPQPTQQAPAATSGAS